MQLVFLDPLDWGYTPFSPLEKPMGGSQSALCCLAPELAALGHEVTPLNNVSRPGVHAGVHCPGHARVLSADYLDRLRCGGGRQQRHGRATARAGMVRGPAGRRTLKPRRAS